MTREEAKAYIIRHCNPDYPKGKTEWERAVNMAIKALKQPEIIRCRDCKYNTSSHKCLQPDSFFLVPADDFYCGFAERRTDV